MLVNIKIGLCIYCSIVKCFAQQFRNVLQNVFCFSTSPGSVDPADIFNIRGGENYNFDLIHFVKSIDRSKEREKKNNPHLCCSFVFFQYRWTSSLWHKINAMFTT
jgi:hypothetical protein